VKYEPGTLLARGYRDGKVVLENKVETTGAPAGVKLWTDHDALVADDRDVAVVNVAVVDAQGRIVPVADNDIRFDVQGPGRIVGVGNGHPASHEPDQFVPTITSAQAQNWRTQIIQGEAENRPEVAENFDDSGWRRVNLSIGRRGGGPGRGPAPAERAGQTAVYRGELELKEMPAAGASLVLGLGPINDQSSVYINGQLAGTTASYERTGYQLDHNIEKLLHPGKNVIAVVIKGTNNPPSLRRGAMLRITTPPPPWRRMAFNGLAQVILRAGHDDGSIRLIATGDGLKESTLDFKAAAAQKN
jgi:beta-galactosidase